MLNRPKTMTNPYPTGEKFNDSGVINFARNFSTILT